MIAMGKVLKTTLLVIVASRMLHLVVLQKHNIIMSATMSTEMLAIKDYYFLRELRDNILLIAHNSIIKLLKIMIG